MRKNSKIDNGFGDGRNSRAPTVALLVVVICILLGGIGTVSFLNAKSERNKESDKDIAATIDIEAIANAEKSECNNGEIMYDAASVSTEIIMDTLETWKEDEPFAILVGTSALITDSVSYDADYCKYIIDANGIPITRQGSDGKEYIVKLLNYGTGLVDNSLYQDDSGNFIALNGFREDNSYREVRDLETEEMRLAEFAKKELQWSSSDGLSIDGTDKYEEHSIYDIDGNQIGIVYFPSIVIK